jgi:Ca2+-transporting ATPase
MPGDIIKLEEGDKVPADATLIESYVLKIDEAILTGESLAVSKETMENIYMGTLVAQGQALAVVTAIGKQTEFGKIADLTVTTKKDLSPLQVELNRIGIFVAKITFIITVILFIAGLFSGETLARNFLFAVSVAVAAVPEGLPATVTIALAIGVQRLARKKAIVKQLTSVETLGSTSVICSDKTGTLTRNEMTVVRAWSPDFSLTVTGTGFTAKGDVLLHHNGADMDIEKAPAPINETMKDFAYISQYCNNSEIENEQDGTVKIIGDPTEVALKVFVEKLKFPLEAFSKKGEVPFNSEQKYMSVEGIIGDAKETVMYLKGAPEVILAMCSAIQRNGKSVTLDTTLIEEVKREADEMSENALRVLGLAKKSKGIMTFIGLVGMIDPPRPEIKEAIRLTGEAGINTIIITGDYVKTAEAIARQIGLNVPADHSMLGSDLDAMDEKSIQEMLKDKKPWIFSRVNPVHKMVIVNALKANGEVVAVTGDGVNDAPALKRADIGVSMGITGTEVSKEAANMILTDDSYATIVNAVKEGRTIYDNMKKFVYYVFSSNSAELFTIFSALIFSFPPPLTAILILSVDLGTDLLPSLALGVDTADKDIMKRPPRDVNQKIMDKPFVLRLLFIGLVIGTVSVAIYIFFLYSYGWTWGMPLDNDDLAYLKGSTAAFSTLILLQLVNSYMARSKTRSVFALRFLGNKHLIGAILASGLLMVAMVHIPLLNDILHTVPLNLSEWTIIILGAFVVLFAEELRKLLAKQHE